jgi:hypothetical protein
MYLCYQKHLLKCGLIREIAYFVHGWIVDTSIEHDYEFFSGYLKVSLEEMIVSLRDDSQLLFEIEHFAEDQEMQGDDEFTLYPDGFTAKKFLGVIEQQKIW